MPSYTITARVNQIVTKEVEIVVTAASAAKAEDKAREAMNEYPDKVTVSGVERILTTDSKYWIPRDIEIIEIERTKADAP